MIRRFVRCAESVCRPWANGEGGGGLMKKTWKWLKKVTGYRGSGTGILFVVAGEDGVPEILSARRQSEIWSVSGGRQDRGCDGVCIGDAPAPVSTEGM